MSNPVQPTGTKPAAVLWKKALVLNLAGLLGIASSLLVLPANTPFVLWFGVSAGVLVIFNVAIFVRHRKSVSGTRSTNSKEWNVIIALGVALWILDVLIHVLRR
jgi:hypothetical protein